MSLIDLTIKNGGMFDIPSGESFINQSQRNLHELTKSKQKEDEELI